MKLYEKFNFIQNEEQVYVPEIDENAATSLYERGLEMLKSVDRSAALDGINAIQNLSSELKEFLRPYAESGRVVTEQDIRDFFNR